MAWDFSGGMPNQWGGMGNSGLSILGLNPGYNNANPLTSPWLQGVGAEQNQLMQMLFGGGGNNGMLAAYMNPMSAGGFMSNFLATAPALQGLTRSASEAETARAQQKGEQGILDANSMFAGLGSKYSGANLLAGNRAMQESMGDLSGKIASENFSLLNSLYGNTLNQYANAQGQGLQNLFGLYGLNANNLAGASNPMISATPSMLDQILKLMGGAGSMAGGLGSLAKAGGFGALFT